MLEIILAQTDAIPWDVVGNTAGMGTIAALLVWHMLVRDKRNEAREEKRDIENAKRIEGMDNYIRQSLTTELQASREALRNNDDSFQKFTLCMQRWLDKHEN